MGKKAVIAGGFEWFLKHMRELGRDYPKEWVAIDADGLIGHGKSLAQVQLKALKKKRDVDGVTYVFFPSRKRQ